MKSFFYVLSENTKLIEQQRVNLPGSRPIPPVNRMPAFQFWWHCRFSNRPLHLRGGALAWKSFHKWSLQYLREALAATPVTLAKTSFGVFDYNANATTGPVPELERVPFAQAVDTSTDFSYTQQHSIAAKFPRILKDIDRPQWLGSASCFSPLHYDLADNFLVQLQGRKHLTLFSKNDGDFLYPNVGQALEHYSMVGVQQLHRGRFPMFPKAQAYSVLLEPGDVRWGGIFDAMREGARMIWTPAGRQKIVGFLRGLRASGDAK